MASAGVSSAFRVRYHGHCLPVAQCDWEKCGAQVTRRAREYEEMDPQSRVFDGFLYVTCMSS